jgi:prophage antirepressor-like protein
MLEKRYDCLVKMGTEEKTLPNLLDINPSKFCTREYRTVNLDLDKYFCNRDIHTVGTWENPLFNALDVAKYIDDSHNYLRVVNTQLRRDRDYVMYEYNKKEQIYFTEFGLYKYLMRSNRPKAVEFADQVCEVIHRLRIDGKIELESRMTELQWQLREFYTRYQRAVESETAAHDKLSWETERNNMLQAGYDRPYERKLDHTPKYMANHYINYFIYEYKFRMRQEPNSKNRYLPTSFTIHDIPEETLMEIYKDANVCFKGRDNEGMWESVVSRLEKYLTRNP